MNQTPWGRIATIMLPVFDSEIYVNAERLLRHTVEGLELAGSLGARVVSLTGLIPSATDNARALAAAMIARGDADVRRAVTEGLGGKAVVAWHKDAALPANLPDMGKVMHWDLAIGDWSHYTSGSDMDRMVAGTMTVEQFKAKLLAARDN